MGKEINFEFNGDFIHIIDKPERFKVLYGGVGSGKSYFTVSYFILRGLTMPNQRILVIRKTLASHKQSTFDLFMQLLTKYGLIDDCKINHTNLTITLPNNSQFIFKGMDNPEKMKSINNIDAIYVEEATDLNLADFQQLNKRLRGKERIKPEIFVLFNPIDMTNWVYDYFFKKGQKSTYIFKSNYKNNIENLDDSYIETLEDLKRTDLYSYTTDVLGEWGSRGKLVYKNWEAKDFVYEDVLRNFRKKGVNFKFTVGMDFGWNDPATITCSLVDLDKKEIWVYDAYSSSEMMNADIIDVLQSKGVLSQTIYADSADPSAIAELKSLGARRIVGAKKHGESGRQAGIQYIKGFRVYIKSDLSGFIHEFKHYEYVKDEKTGVYSDSPKDGNDHYLDGFRYSITPFMGQVTRQRSTLTANGINA